MISPALAICDLIETLPENLSAGQLFHKVWGRLPSGECGYCALGWLLHMRGASDEELIEGDLSKLMRTYLPELPFARLGELTRANDIARPSRRRRMAREAARRIAGCES